MSIPNTSRADQPRRPVAPAPWRSAVPDLRPGLRILLRPETFIAGAAILLAALQATSAATTLDVSSFWTDELYSVAIAGQPTLSEAVRQALYDVHPPLYYLSLFFWTSLVGPGEVAGRALSVVLAIAALPTLYVGLKPVATRTSRLVVCAAAAAAPFWLDQAQNARMYALGLLIGSLLLALFIRALVAAAERRAPSAAVAAGVVTVGFLYAFTHYYMFIAAAAVLGLLTLVTPGLRWKLIYAAAGLGLCAALVAYIALIRTTTSFDLGATWFSNDPGFLALNAVDGVRQLVDIRVAAILLTASVAALVLTRRRPLDGASLLKLRILLALTLVCGAVLFGGLAISLSFAPSFSDRNVATCAPFFWAGACLTLDLSRAQLPRRAFVGVCALLLAFVGLDVIGAAALVAHPRREEWRAAGRFVQAQAACRDEPLPVLFRIYGEAAPPATMVGQVQLRNAYYTGVRPDQVLVSTFDGERYRLSDAAQRTVQQRLADPAACSVLMQAVHVGGFDPRAVQRDLQALAPPGSARAVAIRPFGHVVAGRPAVDAYLFVAQARPAGAGAQGQGPTRAVTLGLQ